MNNSIKHWGRESGNIHSLSKSFLSVADVARASMLYASVIPALPSVPNNFRQCYVLSINESELIGLRVDWVKKYWTMFKIQVYKLLKPTF